MAWFVLNYQHCTFLPEGGAESLQIDCSDATLSEQLRLKSTREKYSSQDRRMEYSHCSLSGMMSRLLEPIIRTREAISKDSGALRTISVLQEASPVRISQSQEREQDWKARVQAYGVRCGELLAKWDRNTSSWRTPQCLLFEDSTECLETLPNWGMTHDGELSELTMQVLHTTESDSGFPEFWATPVTKDKLPPKSEKALLKEAGQRPCRRKPCNLRDQVSQQDKWNEIKGIGKLWLTNMECHTEDEINE